MHRVCLGDSTCEIRCGRTAGGCWGVFVYLSLSSPHVVSVTQARGSGNKRAAVETLHRLMLLCLPFPLLVCRHQPARTSSLWRTDLRVVRPSPLYRVEQGRSSTGLNINTPGPLFISPCSLCVCVLCLVFHKARALAFTLPHMLGATKAGLVFHLGTSWLNKRDTYACTCCTSLPHWRPSTRSFQTCKFACPVACGPARRKERTNVKRDLYIRPARLPERCL